MRPGAPCRYTREVVPLAFLALAPVVLRRAAKVDDRAQYAMKALIDLGGQDDVRFTGIFNERVRSVEAGAVTTAVESRVTVDVMGIVRQGGLLTSERVEKPDGTLVAPARVEATLLFGVPRIDRLRGFYFPAGPVEAGTGWWHTEPGNEGFKAPPFSSYIKLEAEEKIGRRDVWRASLDANEVEDAAPVRVKGVVWLDKADGSLIKGQWTISGYVYGGATAPLNARYELTRVEIEASKPAPSGVGGGNSSGTAPRRSPSRR